MRNLHAALLVLLFVAPLPAQDKPEPDTPEQAADKVLAAFKAADQKALKALAEKDNPDPWLVADELCFRGEHDAAEVFAKAAPRKDTEKLPAYVASRRGKAPNAAAHKALAAANRALAAKDPKAALAAMDSVDSKGADLVSVRLLYGGGLALRGLRRLQESAKAFGRAADAAERLGWLARAAAAQRHSSTAAYYRSDWRGALAASEQRLALEEARGNRVGVARTLGNIGVVHYKLGAYAKALEYLEQALKLSEELDDRASVAHTLGHIGIIHEILGAHGRALEDQKRALKLTQELGDRAGMARALGNIGLIHKRLGAYARALEYQDQALKLSKELGDRAGVARALANIGIVHGRVGAYARALEYQERALRLSEELGDRALVARTLGNIGNIHTRVGAYARALEYQERALKLKEELDDRVGVAETLGNIGAIHENLGAYAKALDCNERLLKAARELGARPLEAAALVNIGIIHRRLGAHQKALKYLQGALKLTQELGARARVAETLGAIGAIHENLGAYAKALEYRQSSLALAAELGSLWTEVQDLWGLALIHLDLGKPADAARAARQGVEKLPLLVGRLAEEQGAIARDQWAGLLETGVRSGMQLDDPGEVSFFLESGRAGALLESLGGREALGGVTIPEELRHEEMEARMAVLAARAHHGRALKAGKRKEIREAREALEEARGKVLDVVSKIQREAKAAANVVYPRAAPLEEIRASLAEDEALILYALLSGQAVALVVRRDGARAVQLGKTATIEETCAALTGSAGHGGARGLTFAKKTAKGDLFDPGSDPSAHVERLRRLVVAPLALDRTDTRLLISPHGALSSVPFALLARAAEVVYVPSGTTHGVLRDEGSKRGRGVLALGDPHYGTKIDEKALMVLRRGRELGRLPGTRKEAESLGDVVLLGAKATEKGLVEALGKQPRWRAVHLACHGLIDPERPMLSSLALTAEGEDDGFLTVLEVFSTKIPADLVVLSACETAKGRAYKAEGVIGFTRAFMFAGAPRVIVSLWKVDDEATKALMVKFYELWNPKDGSKGLPTATALKKAQGFVASHEKWKHPYYWAAWQLWGLPD